MKCKECSESLLLKIKGFKPPLLRVTNYEIVDIRAHNFTPEHEIKDIINPYSKPKEYDYCADKLCLIVLFDLTIPKWDITFIGVAKWKKSLYAHHMMKHSGTNTYFTFGGIYSSSCKPNFNKSANTPENLCANRAKIKFNSPEKERVFFNELEKALEKERIKYVSLRRQCLG